jgi:hypothetical protein
VSVTLYHRLILPADSNHHGTLYAGSLLRLALEAGYATAWRHVGPQANLVLRRVLNLECLRPVPVGTVIEIEGAVLHGRMPISSPAWSARPLKPVRARGWRRCSASPRLTRRGGRTACQRGPGRRVFPTRIPGGGWASGCTSYCTSAKRPWTGTPVEPYLGKLWGTRWRWTGR